MIMYNARQSIDYRWMPISPLGMRIFPDSDFPQTHVLASFTDIFNEVTGCFDLQKEKSEPMQILISKICIIVQISLWQILFALNSIFIPIMGL